MAEPLNLKTIEQRHSFMSLCYSLKLRVIPTGKLRDESTGAPNERLFHSENASLNKNGINTFFNTVARYVPRWVGVLPSHHYNKVNDKQPHIACPPFLCFPPSRGHPRVSSSSHFSGNNTYSQTTHIVSPTFLLEPLVNPHHEIYLRQDQNNTSTSSNTNCLHSVNPPRTNSLHPA